MNGTYWILEKTEEEKFPYRLSIAQDGKPILRLRVQERWPGTKGHIFCLREDEIEREREWSPPVEEVERLPVISVNRYGKRISVVLDRSKNKRCDFLFLKRQYKSKEGEYEQIFWRTQQGLRQRKPKVKLTLRGTESLRILVDTSERYSWNFRGCNIERAKLPVGDYSLKGDNGLLAVVERKTFENLLAEFGRMSIFHQALGELEKYSHSALVVEAMYADFLKPEKLKYYPPAFAAKAIGELHAMHPSLNIIFAGNRKLAGEWTLRFFAAVKAHEEDVPHPKVAEAVAQYNSGQDRQSQPSWRGGAYYEVRKTIEEMTEQFTFSVLREVCPDVLDSTLRRALSDLKKEGTITCQGKGRKSYWEKT